MERELLAAMPRLASVSIAKKLPNGLGISFTKRTFFALFCTMAAPPENPSCGYMDRTGFLYDEAPDALGSLLLKIESNAPEIKIGAQALDPDTAAKLEQWGDALSADLGLRVVGYTLSSAEPDELRAETADGFSLIIKKNDDPVAVVKVLRTLLNEEIKARRQKLDYIDLRFGNKVFFKFKES